MNIDINLPCCQLSSLTLDTQREKMIQILSFMINISLILSIPVMRMRLCIASNDPYRLQSQCVICNNKRFNQSIRQCVSGNYLPANVTFEESYCFIKHCRQQMPHIPPQPYNYVNNNMDIISEATIDQYNDYLYHANSLRLRPPAIIHIGRPLRPGFLSGKPAIIGKRSVDQISNQMKLNVFDDKKLIMTFNVI